MSNELTCSTYKKVKIYLTVRVVHYVYDKTRIED